MNSYQYSDNEQQPILADISGEEHPNLSMVGDAPRSNIKWIRSAGLALAAFAFVAFVARSSGETTNAEVLPVTEKLVALEGSSKAAVTPCTFDECYSSNCNWKVAPYTCLFMNGGPHGGCSPTPWMVPATCTRQCDLSKCGDTEIPTDSKSCDIACDSKWCETTGERLCGSTAPYQCTGGSSTYGCSDDEFMWTFKSSTSTCSSCCNAAKCP